MRAAKPLQQQIKDLWEKYQAAGLEERKRLLPKIQGMERIIIDRNVLGIDLEKRGRVDDAIGLYEENIADQVDGYHPYERLRVIYAKRKQYPDAIRVCKAALATKLDDIQRHRFQDWITKYEAL